MASLNAASRRRNAQNHQLRIIGYLRVSTEDQARDGVSLDAQRNRLEAHAAAHDYELVRVVADEGVSGKVAPSRRPGLRRVLDDIKGGDADGIAFLKLDRLSRSVRDILKLADRAKRKGWHIISVAEHIDTSSAAGRFTLGVLALLSEMEADQVSERTTLGMAQVARQGRARSRFLPFGYRIEGEPDKTTLTRGDRRPLVEHEHEMALRQTIIELRAKGLGAQRIANHLNSSGQLNPRTCQPWTTPTVAALLRTLQRRALLSV